MKPKVLLIYGTTNIHLGLWNDLKNDDRVILRTTQERNLNLVERKLHKLLMYIDCRKETHLKHLFYQYNDIFKLIRNVNNLIIIDGALKTINIQELFKCKKINPNLKVHLYLLNSMDAQSPLMKRVRPKITKFSWDKIFTFDPMDAQKYHYYYLGFNYYSMHHFDTPQIQNKSESDAYFVGGLKGGRSNLILDIHNLLVSKDVVCDFFLMPYKDDIAPQKTGIYYYRGWRPYEDILKHVLGTNCVIEIMQEGQTGATLRYFESVIMNKKLLTNNPNIVNFPFYNPKWMKIFRNLEDIDTDWIKQRENVEYNYNGEFSPIHFIDFFLNKDEAI